MKRLSGGWFGVVIAVFLVAGGALWATLDSAAPQTDLAAWVPQGALLSLETQDFSTLLQVWTSSAEDAAWIKSDDYAAFSHSRLFGRLQEAQKEFAGAAGLPIDQDLLKDLAGRQTFFAWYDIGGLQVVYVTRMTPTQLQQSRLWQRRKKFDTRQAGGVTFYVKTGGASNDAGEASKTDASSDASSTGDGSAGTEDNSQSEARTVAFAESGEWLVLSTSEELMAQTLDLMAAKDHAGENSLAEQGWYKDAKTAAAGPEGDLRMVLDLEKITKTPQFRTYWIQQNVTEMTQYKAAVADVYRKNDEIREERVLIPKAGGTTITDVDLGQLAALAPDHTVVYRASARPTAGDALRALRTKVLERGLGEYEDATVAPIVTIGAPQAGSTTDLETRIDEPLVVTSDRPDTLSLLAEVLQSASLNAMMTVDRNSVDGRADGIWTPFASAVVLMSDQDWDPHAIEDAVQAWVENGLTVGSLGVTWQQKTAHGVTYVAMNDVQGLQLYVAGHLCVISDDASLLEEMLEKRQVKTTTAQSATMLAGFDHHAARKSFAQWTSVVDELTSKEDVKRSATADGLATDQTPGQSPPFFGKDMKGLSDAFAALRQEQFIARHDGAVVRQTVTYSWQR